MECKGDRIEFWTRLNEILVDRGNNFYVRKPTTNYWYDVAIGTSDVHVSLTIVSMEECVGVELNIRDNKV